LLSYLSALTFYSLAGLFDSLYISLLCADCSPLLCLPLLHMIPMIFSKISNLSITGNLSSPASCPALFISDPYRPIVRVQFHGRFLLPPFPPVLHSTCFSLCFLTRQPGPRPQLLLKMYLSTLLAVTPPFPLIPTPTS
jgi:hypothetical protein